MFAFLPKTNPKMCGISESDAEDVEGLMGISAGETKQKISLLGNKALKYNEGSPKDRRYDACFYEITADESDQDFATDT